MDNLINKSYKYAIVGVSEDKGKWGRKLFDRMSELGFEVYPVNPKYPVIGEDKCYSKIADIPFQIDVLVCVVPPVVTENYVQEAGLLGIPKVWMQPGSESERAMEICKEFNIECVVACFVVDGLHTTWN
jgi:uncharacterized protein